MTRHIFVVQTNPAEGREGEYDDWHANVHVPEALAVAGFRSAQRFRIAPALRPGAASYPYGYLTIYEMEGDPVAALQALAAAVPGMQMSSAMADDRQLHVFEALGDRIQPALLP
jgi:hypothetical protein